MVTISAKVIHEYLQMGAHDVYDGEKWIYDTYLDNLNEQVEGADENGYDENPDLPEAAYYELQKCDLTVIVADRGMIENHIGGDNVISIVETVLAAQRAEYTICAWYGPNTEALVVGYRASELKVTTE